MLLSTKYFNVFKSDYYCKIYTNYYLINIILESLDAPTVLYIGRTGAYGKENYIFYDNYRLSGDYSEQLKFY